MNKKFTRRGQLVRIKPEALKIFNTHTDKRLYGKYAIIIDFGVTRHDTRYVKVAFGAHIAKIALGLLEVLTD